MYKEIQLSVILGGRGELRLFQVLRLLFLPNVPGAMFIQVATSIPDYRLCIQLGLHTSLQHYNFSNSFAASFNI